MVYSNTNLSALGATDRQLADDCLSNDPTGTFSVGMPLAGFSKTNDADRFLFWCPDGIPAGDSVLVASSRLGRKLDEAPDWFDALRTLATQISQQASFLITSPGTTTDPFIRRVAELFDIPSLEFHPFPGHPSSRSLESIKRSVPPSTKQPGRRFLVFYKPIDPPAGIRIPEINIDELLMMLAKSAVLLSVRKNGNIHLSAQRRLHCQTDHSTRLLINRRRTSASVESDLLKRGAAGWWLYPKPHQAMESIDIPSPDSQCSQPDLLNLNQIQAHRYLSHWTRRRVGRWPDQSGTEYLDDLIFHSPRCQHNELASLCRILAANRILGSHALTRDQRDVVCFSNHPLTSLLERRIYRSHLGRWDFEPYGIAIDRKQLTQLGAQPVIYGNEADWGRLTILEQAFFQRRRSNSGDIDWSIEEEWRMLGDLYLERIPVDQAIVFVKTRSDADVVIKLSRWPVVVLSPGASSTNVDAGNR